jgi:hypothetical protein
MPSLKRLLARVAVAGLLLSPALTVAPARAVSLDEACAKFAAKLNAAVAAGDTKQAKTIYTQGSERVASRFNGATCPNVKPPA